MAKTKKEKVLTMDDFVIFTNKELKKNPDAVKMNLYKKSKKIYVRLEANEMEEYKATNFIETIIENMDKNDEIDTNIRFSIDFIEQVAKRNKLLVNDKEFKDKGGQRIGDSMSNSIASRLIVSLLNGDCCMPNIQAIFVKIKGTDKVCLCINDGMQRICAILRYISGDLTITGTNTVLDGTKFEDLPSEVSDIFFTRLVNFHIIHTCLCEYRADFFRTLNTTSTKMTLGELINSKYSRLAIVDEAKSLMKDPQVKAYFLNTNKEDDKHFLGVAELLFATAAHYMKATEASTRGIGGGKAEIINTFVEFDEVSNYKDEVKELMDFVPQVCRKTNYYFSPFINKKIDKENRVPMSGKYFPEGYEPFARKYAVISAHSSIAFCITIGLFDIIDTMDRDHVREIAMNLDIVFADDFFKQTYNTSVNAKKIMERIDYAWEVAVEPVLDKYGYTA